MSASTDIHLVVQRTIAAPPGAVFDAWTTPAVLRRWFAAHGGIRDLHVEGWEGTLRNLEARGLPEAAA